MYTRDDYVNDFFALDEDTQLALADLAIRWMVRADGRGYDYTANY